MLNEYQSTSVISKLWSFNPILFQERQSSIHKKAPPPAHLIWKCNKLVIQTLERLLALNIHKSPVKIIISL